MPIIPLALGLLLNIGRWEVTASSLAIVGLTSPLGSDTMSSTRRASERIVNFDGNR